MNWNSTITRLKFVFYGSIVIFALLLIYNFDLFGATPPLILLIVLFVAAIPFFLGFILQLILYRIDIPKYIPWIVSTLIIVPSWYFSGAENIFVTTIIYEIIYIVVSIIIYAGFMESGIAVSCKLRNKLEHNNPMQRTR